MKFSDHSGRIVDRVEPKFLVELRDAEALRDAAPRPQLHLWLSGSHPSHRAADANANAPGEMAPGRPVPGGEPPIYRGPFDPNGGASSGGLPAVTRGQGGEPAPQFDQPQMPPGTMLNPDEEAEERMHEPTYVDARSLKITGRDQRGENWEALVFNRSGVQAPSGWPQSIGDQLYAMQDAFADNSHVHTLGRYQAMLDRHYGARR
jgi:hypothetical protein